MEQQETPASKSSGQINIKNFSVMKGDHLSSVVGKMAWDMKFYAVFYIVYGAFMCLTIIGAVIGIPMIIYNLKLKDSADQFNQFIDTNDFFKLSKAFENQRKFFFFNKILIIIGLVFIAIYIILFIIFGASLLFSPETGSFA